MRSGNGRHRRPRQAPAIIVAAGVTGASIALPLFGASGAQAAQTATWDQVAECESGGMWSADEGNGFYGGLQLTLDMWKDYGGTEYAPRPDLASRSQQISVAQSILGDRGPDAWPSCALGAGLTDGSGAPDVDPGGTATRDPGAGRGETGGRERDGSSSPESDRSGTSDGAGKPDSSGSAEKPAAPHTSESPDGLDGSASDTPTSDGSASDDPTSDGSDDPADSASDGSKGSSADPSADPSPSGRHRGSPDAGGRAEDGDSADGQPSGRHASRDAVDRDQGPTGDDYTVRPGDNLSGIAEDRNVSRGWEGLYESNEDLIGIDPDLIIPGQRLDLTIREQ
ncbi:transglycosylase family protein [Streptomyces violaceusniger]|uniref:Transglycosylase-like domain protein n=1 Tax=Streptomyces violaceusniger (strain Tu 4113) TaxID=653045 RepID=G2NXJ2_STRV4|nr:transglycosylase family protein [Streptomyces violaceusniger]AEM87812.1 Transglycosylase-like domain protein [Streptomyces violaceusniger Tu 4113]